MGGKKGNRTKGNTRPSSSGRTAEILSARGVTDFVGFTGLTTEVPGFVASSASDDVETAVDSDFRMVMKKITKRDTITRVKALQEFSDLCQSKDEVAVKGALPYWPRLFVRLAVDHDRRVREVAHHANKQLVTKVKKDLAPYLKTMMGTWVVTMCDPYAPASSAAQEAFHLAFPSGKQPEALEFCRDEIFNFISDILFHQTSKTLSDISTPTPEEQDSKYIHLLSSSLKGLKLFITTATDLNNEKTLQCLTDILEDNKFWKYANHKDPEVQIAWYLFTSSLCQKMPDLSSKYASKLAPLTLGRINETQPVVASLVWDSMLHMLLRFDCFWEFVNAQKAVLPQLMKLLQNGGNGNANTIFKNLLPFISKIPPEVYGTKLKFFSNLFENFKQGLLNEKVQNSQSELKAVIQSFLECLQFVLLNNLRPVEEETEIRLNLVQNCLFPVVELAILNVDCHIQKPFFSELGFFLQALENQISQDGNPEMSDSLKCTLVNFWNNICHLFSEVLLLPEDTDVEVKIKHFIQFFQHIHLKEHVKKQKKVMFSKEPDREDQAGKFVGLREKFLKGIRVTNTIKMSTLVLHSLKNKPYILHLNLLSEMVHTISSYELFSELLRKYFDLECTDANDDTVVKFVKEVLLHWLQNRETIFGSADSVISAILGMVVDACSCIPQQKAFTILNDSCIMQDFHVLEKLISKLIASQYELPVLHSWLKSDELGKNLVLLTTNIVQNIDAFSKSSKPHSSWELLKICFTATRDFEPLIGIEYLNQIITVLTSVLLKQPVDIESTSGVVFFVCELAQNLLRSCLGCYQLTAVDDFLVCLFEFSCSNRSLSKELQSHIKQTWCMGTEQLVEFQGGFLKTDGFLSNVVQFIQDSLLTRTFHYNQLADISMIEDNALCFLHTVSEKVPGNEVSCLDKASLVRILIDKILPTKDLWLTMEEELLNGVKSSEIHNADFPVAQIVNSGELQIPRVLVMARFLVKVMKDFVNCLASNDKADKPELSENEKKFFIENIENLYLVVTYMGHLFVHPSVENRCEITDTFLEITNIVSSLHQYIAMKDVIQIFDGFIERCKGGNRLHFLVFQTIFLLFKHDMTAVHLWISSHIPSLDASSSLFSYEIIKFLLPCASESDVKIVFDKLCSCFNIDDTLDISACKQMLVALSYCFRRDSLNYPSSNEITQIFKYLQNLKTKSDSGFLGDVMIKQDNLLEVEFSAAVAELSICFLLGSKEIPELCDVLDFILCTLCGWISTVHNSVSILCDNQNYMMFAQKVFQLLSLVKNYVSSDEAKENSPDLLDEWKDLYFPNIYSHVMPMFFQLCQRGCVPNYQSWEAEHMLDELSNSLRNLPSNDLLSCETKMLQSSSKTNEVLGLSESLYSLIISEVPAVQWATHYLLVALMPNLAEVASEDVLKGQCNRDRDDESSQCLSVLPVSEVLASSGQIVDTLLSEFHVEDCCLVKPFTDSYAYTLAYLLSWLHMIKIFSCSNSEVRSEYASNFQDSKLLDSLLLNLFRLMPNNPVTGDKTMLFTEPYHPEKASTASIKIIQKLACQVYLNTLSHLPALVRHWWNKQDKRTADVVNKFTMTYVSSLISLEEIKSVQDTQVNFDNMTVKARPTAREVVAMYTMEDITIELVIKLPHNHPLGPVSVEAGQRIGVGLTQWRHWMLQLTTFLTHQNGSILDALSLWKRNVDKRFEGVEECMICFYVLHGATCQLPRLTCKTCKKKFHSACLYKWFSTSQNASCPLCRNLF